MLTFIRLCWVNQAYFNLHTTGDILHSVLFSQQFDLIDWPMLSTFALLRMSKQILLQVVLSSAYYGSNYSLLKLIAFV